MMNTQSNKADHGVIQSSIALLQERFRQVQRVKEMRENKELLRMFSDYKNAPITSTTTSTTVTNIIPSTTVTTTSTSSGNNISINLNDKINLINKNNSTIISEDCTMQYDDDNDNDELQIFIPPNYFSNKNRNSSCYSSSSSATSTTTASLSHNNHMINLNDVSLSLWPPMSYTNNNSNISNNNNVGGFGDTLSMLRPTAVAKEVMINRPTTCAYMEDSHHHVSDVDTTLHL